MPRVVIEFEGTTPATPGTKGSLAINLFKMDGTTAAAPWVWQNMKAGLTRKSSPTTSTSGDRYSQEFVLEDDHASEQFSG